MATFSDYFQKALADGSRPVKSTPPPSQGIPDFSGLKSAADAQAESQSPLNWAIDILSRPLYGVTNGVSGSIDSGIEAAAKLKDGDVLGAVGSVFTPLGGKIAEGVFSNDPSAKITTSDIIEEATDKVGLATNPRYKDEENNVAPALKGALGFVGDVAGDPLTWVPGGVLVKGAKALGQGAKVALKAGAEATGRGLKAGAEALVDSKAARTAGEAAEDLAPTETRATARTAEEASPAADDNPFLVDANAPKGASVPEGSASLADEVPAPSPKTPTEAVAQAAPTLRELFDASEKAPVMRKEISDIIESVGKGAKKESPVLTAPKWVNENEKAKPAQFFSREGLDENAAHPLEADPLARKTLGELRGILRDPRFPDAVKGRAKALLDTAYTGYRESTEAAHSNVVVTALDEFRNRVQTDRARVELAVGPELLNLLSRKNTPASFERALHNINRALDPQTDLEKFFRANKQLAPAVQSGLGIPSHVKPTPNTAADLGKAESVVVDDDLTREVFARTLGQETPTSKVFRKRYPAGKGTTVFTDKDKEIRLGNSWRKLNTFFQYTLYRNLEAVLKKRMTQVAGKEEGAKLFGRANAVARKDAIEALGSEIADSIQTFGTKMHIGVNDDLLPVTFPEVYRMTFEAFDDSDKALLALYNGGSNVAFTVLMQATHTAAMAGDLKALGRDGVLSLRQEIIDMLTDPKKFGVRGGYSGGDIPNHLNTANAKAYVYAPNQKKSAEAFAKKVGGSVKPTEGKAWQVVLPKGALVNDLADAVLKAQPKTVQRIADNALAWKQRGLSEASELSNKELKGIEKMLADGSYRSEVVHSVDNIPKSVADTATEVGATQDAVNMATEVAQGAVGEADITFAKTQEKLNKAALDAMAKGLKAPKSAVAEASQKTSDDVARQVDEAAEEAFDEVDKLDGPGAGADDVPVEDLSDSMPVLAQQGTINRFLNGITDVFNQAKGMERVWPLWHSKRTVSGQYLEHKANQIRDLAKTFSPEVRVAAMKAVQSGAVNANPEIHAAAQQIDAIMRGFWNLTEDAADGRFIDNVFLAVEPNVDHINGVLAMKGLPDDVRFTGDSLEEMLDGWRQWDIKDPADFLVRISDAAATVAEHRAIVGNFVTTFKKEGLVSSTYQPGMVRIVASDKSTFGGLLPEGLFVDKGLAQELHRLDIMTRADRKMQGEVQHVLTNYYLPAQSIWKSLVTVWRPGHHIRNVASNFFMQFVGRGTRHLLSSQKDALKVLGVRNAYPEVDIVSSLKSLGDEAIPQGGDVIAHSDALGDFTADWFLRTFNDNGLRTSHTVSEDLLLDSLTKSPVTQAATKLNASKGGQVAGDVSQFTDHYGKMSYFIQAFKQELRTAGPHTKIESIVQKVVREVKRSHPDSNMLTPTESKYRWVIPFYTWFAKTIPFVIESAARNPGRVMAFPKASYNLAVANGINPDSLSDPFPEDQLFPSFVTEGFFGPQFVGPDGEYININPGVQHFDIFREIGTDPIRGLVGMTSPLLRMPAELLTGSQMSTGARINDTSDYLDQNLPLVNYLANVTGVSPTGSIASVLSGDGLDPQHQVETGGKGALDQQLSLLNFLFGMNASNWSRQSFINSAEIEKRNAEREK